MRTASSYTLQSPLPPLQICGLVHRLQMQQAKVHTELQSYVINVGVCYHNHATTNASVVGASLFNDLLILEEVNKMLLSFTGV